MMEDVYFARTYMCTWTGMYMVCLERSDTRAPAKNILTFICLYISVCRCGQYAGGRKAYPTNEYHFYIPNETAYSNYYTYELLAKDYQHMELRNLPSPRTSKHTIVPLQASHGLIFPTQYKIYSRNILHPHGVTGHSDGNPCEMFLRYLLNARLYSSTISLVLLDLMLNFGYLNHDLVTFWMTLHT